MDFQCERCQPVSFLEPLARMLKGEFPLGTSECFETYVRFVGENAQACDVEQEDMQVNPGSLHSVRAHIGPVVGRGSFRRPAAGLKGVTAESGLGKAYGKGPSAGPG